MVAPPLWGAAVVQYGFRSGRVSKAAGFIKDNMPLTQPGVFSDGEAYDVAAFMNSHRRPDYAPKVFDWPKVKSPSIPPINRRHNHTGG